MKIAHCTIITSDYLHYALALYGSVSRYRSDIEFHLLVVNGVAGFDFLSEEFPNIRVYEPDELCGDGIAYRIRAKYELQDQDCFRWSMKPVLISHLLKQGYDQVFYLDSDLYFFSDFNFLSGALADHNVLLSPHWRASRPGQDEGNYSVLQTNGLYNGGFIAASEGGIPAMEWWAEACEFRCTKDPAKGYFDDQGYLNLLPIYFQGVDIIRHRGCNIANWNQLECRRTRETDGRVRINNQWDIVFIHFTHSTIKGITQGEDLLLRPLLEQYQQTLGHFKAYVGERLEGYGQTKIELSDRMRSWAKTWVGSVKSRQAPFLAPSRTPGNIDHYTIHSAILTALKGHHHRFSGVLLDVGCGQSPYKTMLLSPPGKVERYIGLDFESNPIHRNQPDITWQEGKIPLGKATVDCVLCTEVFEHCPDPEGVMSEINRVLKPGGELFFTVPFVWPLHEVPYDEYRYTPFSLERHLSSSGFTEINIKPMGGWDASLAQMLGLWVRRRRMNRWLTAILSLLLWPFILFLGFLDRYVETRFNESTMISGLYGTASKPR